MIAKAAAIIALLILLLIIAIQHTQPAVLHLLVWQASLASILFVLVSFIIGLLIGCRLMIGRLKKNPYIDISFSHLWQVLLAHYFERILMGRAKSLDGE